ncbi:MAG: putative quinol monooxygenase [Ilumatobacteraceae bacterium]
MLIIAGEIRMEPGTRAQFFEAVAPMVTATLQESGCQTYAFTPDPDDADLVRLYELWDDDESLQGHFDSAHMAEWRARSADLPVTGRNLHRYTISEATPLA